MFALGRKPEVVVNKLHELLLQLHEDRGLHALAP